MRYIYLLLITFIFTACGNQKLRFVRTNVTKQKVVEINDIPSLKIKTETAFTLETNKEVPGTENASSSSADLKSDESTEEETLNLPEVVSSSFPKSVQDSTVVSDAEAQSIMNEALRAERLGQWSNRLPFLFFLLLIAAITLSLNYSPVGVVLTIFFLLLAFASLVLSIILGAKSLGAAYNTPKGRSRAIMGMIISSIILTTLLVLGVFAFF